MVVEVSFFLWKVVGVVRERVIGYELEEMDGNGEFEFIFLFWKERKG